ncbi:unnamed protein product [Cylindrotheca closterium]|uniref:Uncharacterized protein n=1 Tax=Cylindrotheca closterium TaxID=2856 RepID=A0AAD2G0C4_9STRA|nr:unnamed protein product [Cylindrotheca closterium]
MYSDALKDEEEQRRNASRLGFQIYHDKVDSIRIVGERHSGTTFLARYLQSCFPNISVDDHFVNGKHWFQPSPEYVVETSNRIGESGLAATAMNDYFHDKTWWQIAQADDPSSYFQSTLVVALFRNPYDWIEGMRRIPHHWPNHVDLIPKDKSTLAEVDYQKNKRQRQRHQRRLLRRKLKGSIVQKSFVKATSLDWKEFVKRPMHLSDYEEKDKGILCQRGFPFEMVSPCDPDHSYVPASIRHIPSSFLRNLAFEVDDAVYELNISGHPFKNPLELRSAKITNMLNLANDWNLGAFGAIQYDEILGERLTELVQKIGSIVGLENTCSSKNSTFQKIPYNHSRSFRSWVREHADWNVEARVGF